MLLRNFGDSVSLSTSDSPFSPAPSLAPHEAGVSRQRAWVEVSSAAISANARALCRLIGPTSLMAVVKADGYGHGAVSVARAALSGGASSFMQSAPKAEANVTMPDWNGVMPKPT